MSGLIKQRTRKRQFGKKEQVKNMEKDDIKKLVGTHRSHLSFFQKNSERAGVCGTVRWFAFDSGAQGCSVGRLFRRFFLSRCFLGDQLDATVLIQDIGTQHRERHDRQDNKALFAGQAVKVVDH